MKTDKQNEPKPSNKMPDGLNGESTITFGPHKGKKLSEIPASYLLRLFYANIAFGALKIYIFDHLEILNAETSINNKNQFYSKKYFSKALKH